MGDIFQGSHISFSFGNFYFTSNFVNQRCVFVLVPDTAVGGLLRPRRRVGGRNVFDRLVNALGEFHAGQELLLHRPPSQGLRPRGRRGHERPHRRQRDHCHHDGNRLPERVQPLVSNRLTKVMQFVRPYFGHCLFQCPLW